MFTLKPTITRVDRDRLLELTRIESNRFSWASFIDALEREVSRAQIVEPCCVPGDVVTMGSTVQFSDLRTRQREIYTLVYPGDANLSVGKLSVLSPLGTALLGARVGDRVIVARRAGRRRLTIESVSHQVDASARGAASAAAAPVVVD